MDNKYYTLFHSWCDYLVRQQITDKKSDFFGGFICEGCDTIHGRADNAVFPLLLEYTLTGEKKYLDCAKNLLEFRLLLTHEDGAVQNDFGSQWKGISTFSAVSLLKTILFLGDKIPQDIKTIIEKAALASAKWVTENIRPGFRANINYYAAASEVNALVYRLYGKSEYKEKAEELLLYCLSNFTENGLLTGEGQPHNYRTGKGCAPIDIGYNAEESLPCLVSTAVMLKDEGALQKLSVHALGLVDFMLPDGGWDNSFGVRNNKWTYYGSRTSDGCLSAFSVLSKYNSVFSEVFERAFEMLNKCTCDGALYGGPGYIQAEQKPCIHHTFCHAVDLACVLCEGLPEINRQMLPCEKKELFVKYYPELDTYKIKNGGFYATVTGYDYSTYTYNRGAAHSSGGAMSLLYKENSGPVLAGSVFEYKLTEEFNMQKPSGNVLHKSLIMRAEYEKDGVVYTSCLDKNADIKVFKSGEEIRVNVSAKLCSVSGDCIEDLPVVMSYITGKSEVKIKIEKMTENVSFYLPVICNSAEVHTGNEFERERIFFLTGGFSADNYIFNLKNNVEITII